MKLLISVYLSLLNCLIYLTSISLASLGFPRYSNVSAQRSFYLFLGTDYWWFHLLTRVHSKLLKDVRFSNSSPLPNFLLDWIPCFCLFFIYWVSMSNSGRCLQLCPTLILIKTFLYFDSLFFFIRLVVMLYGIYRFGYIMFPLFLHGFSSSSCLSLSPGLTSLDDGLWPESVASPSLSCLWS